MAPDFEEALNAILEKYPKGERDKRRAAVQTELKRRKAEAHLSPEWHEIMRKAAQAA